jgi:hypothetical protein
MCELSTWHQNVSYVEAHVEILVKQLKVGGDGSINRDQ